MALLYGGAVFTCRHCNQLAYPSQREDASDRAARQADKIRLKLGWETGILNPHEGKPKRMHWRTFDRLVRTHDKFARASVASMQARFGEHSFFQEVAFLLGHDGEKGGQEGGLI
ncbi:hypothetical protein [Thalassococcus profundi]|uniref:hypothetical protein n=1 Tax=Thalassococcus profundi TaxID=2282382 RepID=UPI0011C07A1C|nr:hypothetical protein [Thalassococcus profundi]